MYLSKNVVGFGVQKNLVIHMMFKWLGGGNTTCRSLFPFRCLFLQNVHLFDLQIWC